MALHIVAVVMTASQ